MEFGGASVLVEAPTAGAEVVFGRPLGGFDFSLVHRNTAVVAAAGASVPKAKKTGTTICGVVFKNGIVLGADTRATEGTVISDKNCEKIHYIAPNIYCCGAGTAADTESITALISSQLALLRLSIGTPSRVVTAMTALKRRLFQYQGHISAALVLGGVDVTGAHLYSVYPHGSTDKLPFVSMGSGSLAAMAVLESGYHDDMTEAAAVALIRDAIRAGIFNDLGSGSNVDIRVIRAVAPDASAAPVPAGAAGAATASTTPASTRLPAATAANMAAAGSDATSVPLGNGTLVETTYYRNYEKPNDVDAVRATFERPAARVIPRGATVVLREQFEPASSAHLRGVLDFDDFKRRVPKGPVVPPASLTDAAGAAGAAGGAASGMEVE